MSGKSLITVLAALAALLIAQSAQAVANGSKIAYVSTRAGLAVHTIGIDGLGDQRLTNTPNAAFDGSPDWSPDGTRLAYVCGNFEICVMNADGSGQTKLTSAPTTWPATFTYELDPVWSPDGTRIAFSSNRDQARYDIFVAAADGSSVTRIGGTTADDTNPSWSPDGTKIVFDSEATGNGDLYVMNADGSNVQRLSSKKASETNPDWSPDGTVIAFELGGSQTDIAVVRPDGSGFRRLMKTSFEELDPAWSPDGTQLAFTSDSSGNWDVFLRGPGGRHRLTNGLTAEFAPSWQPASTGMAGVPTGINGPPTVSTDDARVVAEFLRWKMQLTGELTGVGSESLGAAKANATAYRKDSGRAIRALSALHPATTRGKKVRARAMTAFGVTRKVGSHLEAALTLFQHGKRQQATFYVFLAGLELLVWDDAASSAYRVTRLP